MPNPLEVGQGQVDDDAIQWWYYNHAFEVLSLADRFINYLAKSSLLIGVTNLR